MSLLEYNLYLTRKFADGPILTSLNDKDILHVINSAEALCIFDRVSCVYRESENQLDSRYPIYVLTLALNTRSFEQLLEGHAEEFFSWFWYFVSSIKLEFAFIGGGSYVEYYRVAKTSSLDVFSRLGECISQGKIHVVHPFMFFPATFGDSQLQNTIRSAPYFQIIEKKEIGCILALVEGNIHSNKIEIIDPGVRYPDISEYFKNSGCGLSKIQ
jgi:hypothetical protein